MHPDSVGSVPRLEDRDHLRSEQYATGSNLSARIALHDRYSVNPTPWHRWVFDLLECPPEGRVLEVGCGVGRLWSDNLDRLPEGWWITVADLSPGMVAATEAVFAAAGRSVRAEVADVTGLRHASGCFDVVIANHVLYHLPVADRGRALWQLRRVLRPSGALYASTIGRDHLNEIGALVSRHAGVTGYPHGPEAFGMENGRAQLERAFADARWIDYPDRALVTDACAIADFVRSSARAYGISDEAIELISADAQAVIDREGAFPVTKVSGVFVATGTARPAA